MRSFTLAQLRSRLEKLTDTENDTHLSTTEKNEILASAAADTWDVILRAGLGEKVVKSVTFSTTAGTQEYDLQSATYVPLQDFYKVHQIYADEGNNQFRPISRINSAEVMTFRPPTTVVPIKMFYIPSAPTFKTAGSFDDALTFDGVSGWEEHLLQTAAVTVKVKKEEDATPYRQRKKELEDRIAIMGRTDHSEPSRVVRRRYRTNDPFMLYRGTVNAWLIRGDKLNLLYHWGYVP